MMPALCSLAADDQMLRSQMMCHVAACASQSFLGGLVVETQTHSKSPATWLFTPQSLTFRPVFQGFCWLESMGTQSFGQTNMALSKSDDNLLSCCPWKLVFFQHSNGQAWEVAKGFWSGDGNTPFPHTTITITCIIQHDLMDTYQGRAVQRWVHVLSLGRKFKVYYSQVWLCL